MDLQMKSIKKPKSKPLFSSWKKREVLEEDVLKSFRFFNRGILKDNCWLNANTTGRWVEHRSILTVNKPKIVEEKKFIDIKKAVLVISKTGRIRENELLK